MDRIAKALAALLGANNFSLRNFGKTAFLVITIPFFLYLSFQQKNDIDRGTVLIGIYTITNLSIFLSYMMITVVILRVISRYYVHKSIRNLLEWAALFIFLSGLSHLLDALNIYWDQSILGSAAKILTALVSAFIAFNFFSFFKNILSQEASVHYLNNLYSTILRKLDGEELIQEDIDAVKVKLNESLILIKEMNELVRKESSDVKNDPLQPSPQYHNKSGEHHLNP